jgi:glycosyltransferase involved in cell wall biosynthesis
MVLSRYLRKLRSTLCGLRRDNSGMWVYSPIFVPRYTGGAIDLNGTLLAAQTSLLCRLLGIRRPAAWITLPTAVGAVARGSWTSVVVNRCDDFSAFPEIDTGQVRSLERRLLAVADHALYASQVLLEREVTLTRDAVYFGHGVDFEHFAAPRVAAGARPPEALRNVPRPIVGFYGALDDYTWDLELMIKLARHVAHGTVVVIGRRAMDISRLLDEPNVRYLGPIPYAELPAYARCFDVSVLPKIRNDFVLASNPIKLKEYLALGAPIVTTRFPAVDPYEDLLYVGDCHADFLRNVDLALADKSLDNIRRRRQAVARDSWDALADRAARFLDLPDLSEG